MLTGRSDKARRAGVLTGDRVAGAIAFRRTGAPFHATVAKETFRAGFATGATGPTAGTDARTGDRIAGRVVVAGTNFATAFTVVA